MITVFVDGDLPSLSRRRSSGFSRRAVSSGERHVCVRARANIAQGERPSSACGRGQNVPTHARIDASTGVYKNDAWQDVYAANIDVRRLLRRAWRRDSLGVRAVMRSSLHRLTMVNGGICPRCENSGEERRFPRTTYTFVQCSESPMRSRKTNLVEDIQGGFLFLIHDPFHDQCIPALSNASVREGRYARINSIKENDLTGG